MKEFFVLLCIFAPVKVGASAYGADAFEPILKKELSLIQTLLVGSLTGATEVVTTGQPFSYAISMKALKKPLSFKFTHIYTGFLANLGGMVPLTALQILVRVEGERFLAIRQKEPLSSMQKLSVAFVAGAASAIIATPSEAVALYMQLHKEAGITKTTTQACLELKSHAWRGFGVTVLRKGFHSLGYGALAPLAAVTAHKCIGKSDAVTLGAGAVVGVGVGLISQPCTVIKSLLQSDAHKKKYAHSFDAARALYQEAGLRGFYRGGLPRTGRIAFSVPILSGAEQFFTKHVQ